MMCNIFTLVSIYSLLLKTGFFTLLPQPKMTTQYSYQSACFVLSIIQEQKAQNSEQDKDAVIPKIHTESQKTQNSQQAPEQEKPSRSHHDI